MAFGEEMNYVNELTKAMTWLGKQPNTLFIGQQVRYDGNALFKTLSGVPLDKRIELPVAEDMQLGMSIGLSLAGKVPVTIYPRMNFLMCAMNQLVNHLDKIEKYSNGQYKPKVIVRVCVGSTEPMNPGVQHSGDYNLSLENIRIVRLKEESRIFPSYVEAYHATGSTLLIEYGDLYNS
jgi:pyruvate/2-oxoglutarate/acetoin dehydrogenase E1 component